jgi:zona occludens toxin (predicted ATPase)
MLISFLKRDENGEDGSGSKFMGKGDIIFLLVLASLIFGFWYYHNSTKEKTYSHYAKCDALFSADSLSKAKECYENAIDMGYRIDSLDSIGYHRVEKIDSILNSIR